MLKDYALQVIEDTQRMLSDVQYGLQGRFEFRSMSVWLTHFCDVAGLQLMQQLKPFTSRLALRTGLVSPLTQALLNRDLDLLLITGDPLDEHPQLQRFPVLRDPFVVLVPKKHSQHRDLNIQWLAENLPFIQYNRQSRLGTLTDLIARRMNIKLMANYELGQYSDFTALCAGRSWLGDCHRTLHSALSGTAQRG